MTSPHCFLTSTVLIPTILSISGGTAVKVKIGELAKMTGCQVVTIRYYEKEGLLREPERSGGNYRLYGDEEIERLRFIRHCREHGINLAEIRDLLAFKDHPAASCDWINSLIEKHIAGVDEQIASLMHLKTHLQALLQKCPGGKHAECGILESLKKGEACPYCESLRCRHVQSQKGPQKSEEAHQ